jgi:hypothetical protein
MTIAQILWSIVALAALVFVALIVVGFREWRRHEEAKAARAKILQRMSESTEIRYPPASGKKGFNRRQAS